MDMRRTWFTALLALGIILGVALPATAAGAIGQPGLRCGVNPTTDVRLRADLTCQDGFRVAGNPVNIDLAGHTLTVVNGTCSSFGACGAIYGAASVTNGAVVGDLKDVRLTRKVRVTGSVYLGESTVDPSVLDRSVVRNGRVGIFGPNATVKDSDLIGAGPLGGGIGLFDSLRNLSDLSISGNFIDGGGIGLFDSCSSCPGDVSGLIAHNTIARAPGDGISIAGFLPTLGRIEITSNTIRDSVGDGIHVSSGAPSGIGGGPVVLTGNRLNRNGGHGVFRDWTSTDPARGLLDGGGNVARRNGLTPACIGVTCKVI
ncbi:MAG: right-handed parallel beta-helix repeat-containing protein [Acidimicrobiales bacterium]